MNPIKCARISANLTQQDLAERLHIKQSTVSMWETGGSTPRPDSLIELARIFNCTVDDLLRGPPEPKQDSA